ncbi:DNA polymerase ligase N-terminal domain-containing protein [Nocardioides sp. SR21]|uniref:DNA polymerase ligase N-terminal domain-containing protein n=1 Tax=Nocardioides sp. SR21 TaxID=2919501 RepID=UPI001FAA7845|nr:DNA polymerase ligase N-terminal domain-containing protein [Nocardioides sp. SR21]
MIYVVQRHRATTLHFDLRLEVDGVLVSWAVPKEPTTDPRVKRLAVQVDDHELEHATYEDADKTIWDHGTYENLIEPDAAGAIAAGHLKVRLHGARLDGVFALTRTSMNGDPRNWILVKVADPQV